MFIFNIKIQKMIYNLNDYDNNKLINLSFMKLYFESII